MRNACLAGRLHLCAAVGPPPGCASTGRNRRWHRVPVRQPRYPARLDAFGLQTSSNISSFICSTLRSACTCMSPSAPVSSVISFDNSSALRSA
jgi:hypothetical protein